MRIGPHIRIRLVAIGRGQVRLAIDAPADVAIHREEVYERIAQANRDASNNQEGDLPVSMGARLEAVSKLSVEG